MPRCIFFLSCWGGAGKRPFLADEKLSASAPDVGALVLCIGLIGMILRIAVTSKQEEDYYGVNKGFGWHANWFTVGMLLALALKPWQYSNLRKMTYTCHAPILTAFMLVLLVIMNLIFYYNNDLSWVNPELWNVRQVFANYPIGHLYARGGNRFLMSMVFWNALTLVEIIEGPFFVLFMFIITLNANLRYAFVCAVGVPPRRPRSCRTFIAGTATRMASCASRTMFPCENNMSTAESMFCSWSCSLANN